MKKNSNKATKKVYILTWASKHGTVFFETTLTKLESKANGFIKKHYKDSKNYKDNSGFGPYDSFSIHSLMAPSNVDVKFLNQLFNTLMVNPNQLEVVWENPDT